MSGFWHNFAATNIVFAKRNMLGNRSTILLSANYSLGRSWSSLASREGRYDSYVKAIHFCFPLVLHAFITENVYLVYSRDRLGRPFSASSLPANRARRFLVYRKHSGSPVSFQLPPRTSFAMPGAHVKILAIPVILLERGRMLAD